MRAQEIQHSAMGRDLLDHMAQGIRRKSCQVKESLRPPFFGKNPAQRSQGEGGGIVYAIFTLVLNCHNANFTVTKRDNLSYGRGGDRGQNG